MYAIEKQMTKERSRSGMPIWEVIVRDMNGHAVYLDNCYACDLDRMVSELKAAFEIG